MSSNNNNGDILLIKYNDNSSYKIVKYAVNLIIVLLLLWYFVRSVMFSNRVNVINDGFVSGSAASNNGNDNSVNDSNDSRGNDSGSNDNSDSASSDSASSDSASTAQTADSQDTKSTAELLQSAAVTSTPYVLTDNNYRDGSMEKGLYGGTPVYFFSNYDDLRVTQWKMPGKGIYIQNPKMIYQWKEIPREAAEWTKYEDYKNPWFPTYP